MRLWRRLVRAGRHTGRVGQAWLIPARRRLLWRMIAFSRSLPARFEQPLPEMMARLTPPARAQPVAEEAIWPLADAVAAWHFRSPLGICLRRSLLRYYFLREAALPVHIVFGARLKGRPAERTIGGHAWLILNGQPYHEHPADYEGFVPLYTYPPLTNADSPTKKKAEPGR